MTANRGWQRAKRGGLAIVLLLIVATVGIVGSTYVINGTAVHLPYQREFCFAEWCVTPDRVLSGR